jgi:predicted RNase H-like HicB family nuclease
MHYRVAVEDMEPDHWIAWVVDLLGCYSSAKTSAEAIAQAPASISRYFSWISEYDHTLTVPQEPIDIQIAETFLSFPSKRDPEYIVNAFFEDDRRPLSYWDVVIAQDLLGWSREALLRLVQAMDEQRLYQPIPGEIRGSIAGILEHIAGAENWYFEKLDLALDRPRLSSSLLEKLAQVRRNAKEQLWKLIGETRIAENYDEMWSARKVLRRTLWHERDHTQQIEHLSSEL